MKAVYSDVSSCLDVREELFVQGRLRSGVRVHAGQSLFVFGAVEGSVEVGSGGRLVVAGLFSAIVDGNDGLIAFAGSVLTPLETVPGRVLFAEGSVAFTAGASMVVTPAGFRPLSERIPIDLELRDLPVSAVTPDGRGLRPVVWDGFGPLCDAMTRRSDADEQD